MKLFFQKILMGAKAKYQMPGVLSKADKSSQKRFDPAPFYWALIPIKPQSLPKNKPTTDFNEGI